MMRLRTCVRYLTILLLLCAVVPGLGSCRAEQPPTTPPTGEGHATGPGSETGGDTGAMARESAPASTALIDELGRDFVERRVMDVYQRVAPAVVTVTTTVLQPSFFFEPAPAEGTGSGFVIDGEGRILTNFHVVEGARSIEVTFANGTIMPARVVGIDPPNDLAVLAVDATRVELTPAVLGSSTELRVGQRAIAIGNPFGEFGQSLTTGVISALDRTLRGSRDRDITGVIQTDAAINRGNSGGPLLDSAGEVIGINTAIFSPTGTSAGLGFAIPVDTAHRVLPELIEFGRYRHPWLGVIAAYPISEGLAAALELPVTSGLLLVQLAPQSPLQQAGVVGAQRQVIVGNRQVFVGGDIVTAVDGKSISSRSELRTLLETEYRVGDEVEVSVVSNGRENRLRLTLSEQPQ